MSRMDNPLAALSATVWQRRYDAVAKERDEARAEVERLRAVLAALGKAEP
jgi:hypothetical protein